MSQKSEVIRNDYASGINLKEKRKKMIRGNIQEKTASEKSDDSTDI